MVQRGERVFVAAEHEQGPAPEDERRQVVRVGSRGHARNGPLPLPSARCSAVTAPHDRSQSPVQVAVKVQRTAQVRERLVGAAERSQRLSAASARDGRIPVELKRAVEIGKRLSKCSARRLFSPRRRTDRPSSSPSSRDRVSATIARSRSPLDSWSRDSVAAASARTARRPPRRRRPPARSRPAPPRRRARPRRNPGGLSRHLVDELLRMLAEYARRLREPRKVALCSQDSRPQRDEHVVAGRELARPPRVGERLVELAASGRARARPPAAPRCRGRSRARGRGRGAPRRSGRPAGGASRVRREPSREHRRARARGRARRALRRFGQCSQDLAAASVRRSRVRCQRDEAVEVGERRIEAAGPRMQLAALRVSPGERVVGLECAVQVGERLVGAPERPERLSAATARECRFGASSSARSSRRPPHRAVPRASTPLPVA